MKQLIAKPIFFSLVWVLVVALALTAVGCRGEQQGDLMNEYPKDQDTGLSPVLVITAGENTFYAEFENNSSATALIDKLKESPLTLEMHDYGNFEKVGSLPWSLPTNDRRITTAAGDVILYMGSEITIYYDVNTWSFTRLAHIDGATKQALLTAFGKGNVTVTFGVEWK